MAGVWSRLGGVGGEKKRDKDFKLQVRSGGSLLINTRTCHTSPRCEVRCLILAQPSCHPSAQM